MILDKREKEKGLSRIKSKRRFENEIFWGKYMLYEIIKDLKQEYRLFLVEEWKEKRRGRKILKITENV